MDDLVFEERPARGASPTQRVLDSADVARLVAASFGLDRKVVECGPLTGGGFGAVWFVVLDDGQRVVLKASPAAGVPLLRYEQGLIAAEARFFALAAVRAPGVPVPKVLHHGVDRSVLDGDWLFTSHLPGRPLSQLSEATSGGGDMVVRGQHGAAVAELHAVTGDYYGYGGGRTSASTWSGAFAAMVEDLLADAVDWGVRLPVSAAVIRSLIQRHAEVLAAVDRPALVHFDGWDGNVLAEPGGDGSLRMTGLVDGERYLFGDPMMDLVSPALFRRIEDEPQGAFLRGYAAASGSPSVLDEVLLKRLGLCRLYFHLLMTVEMPSRGITLENDPGRHALLARLFEQQVAELEAG